MLAGIEFSQGIGDAWTNITKFVPKLIGALAILIIGWIIAKIIRKVIHRVLTKLKFDDIVDKSGLGGHIEKAGWADSAALLARSALSSAKRPAMVQSLAATAVE